MKRRGFLKILGIAPAVVVLPVLAKTDVQTKAEPVVIDSNGNRTLTIEEVTKEALRIARMNFIRSN